MIDDNDIERTLPATPRRRQDARSQGDVWQSQDLSAALMLGGISLLLSWLGPGLLTACGEWMRVSLSMAPVVRGDRLDAAHWSQPLAALALSVAGLLAAFWLMAIAVRLMQVGPLFVPELVQPRPDRANPLTGFGRLSSSGSLVQGGVWLMRLCVVSGVLWWTAWKESSMLAALTDASPETLAFGLGRLVTTLGLRLCAGLLLIAVIDVGWQWWSHEHRLQMTVDELRDERRQSQRTTPDRGARSAAQQVSSIT